MYKRSKSNPDPKHTLLIDRQVKQEFMMSKTMSKFEFAKSTEIFIRVIFSTRQSKRKHEKRYECN